MLVLTRKISQQIQIGDGVVITILQVKGNSVRVGIEAPREVRVVRGELEPKNDATASTTAAAAVHDRKPSAGSRASQPGNSWKRPEEKMLTVAGRTFASHRAEVRDVRALPDRSCEAASVAAPSIRPLQRLAANLFRSSSLPRR